MIGIKYLSIDILSNNKLRHFYANLYVYLYIRESIVLRKYKLQEFSKSIPGWRFSDEINSINYYVRQ